MPIVICKELGDDWVRHNHRPAVSQAVCESLLKCIWYLLNEKWIWKEWTNVVTTVVHILKSLLVSDIK